MSRDPYLPKFAAVPKRDPYVPTTAETTPVVAELVERAASIAIDIEALAGNLLSWRERVQPDAGLLGRFFSSLLERADIKVNTKRAIQVRELAAEVAWIFHNFRAAQAAKVELMELLVRERDIVDYAVMHKRLTQAELEAQIAEAEARVATAKMKKRMAEELE